MINDSGRGRLLLVDTDSKNITYLKGVAHKTGYDVYTMSHLSQVRKSGALLNIARFDLVAVSSTVARESPEAVTLLREFLDCPVVVYSESSQPVDLTVKAPVHLQTSSI